MRCLDAFRADSSFPRHFASSLYMKSPNIEPLEARIAPATISISAPAPANEGTAALGRTNFDFTVSLDALEAADVTVTASLVAGTASDLDGDYFLPASSIVTIPMGELSATFRVEVAADSLFELDEMFKVVLSSPGAGHMLDAGAFEAEATITNDDATPTIGFLRGIEEVDEGDSGSKQLKFTVELSGPSAQNVTFDWATEFSAVPAAADGVDFQAVSTTPVVITAGSTRAELVVVVNGDATNEADEEFLANITNVMMGGTPLGVTPGQSLQAKGVITNDDVAVRISNASITEGNAGMRQMEFSVSLVQAAVYPVTATFVVESGSATVGEDFNLPASFEVTIPAGSQSALISVPVIGDELDELNETFIARLTGATNAAIGNAIATGTIIDDDATPVLSIGNATMMEGPAGTAEMVFTISLSAASGQTVRVNARTIDGTAISTPVGANIADFTSRNETFTFLPGEVMKEFRVSVAGDARFERDEMFPVELTNVVGATIGTGTGTGTIGNDDALPTLSAPTVTLVEGSDGGPKIFTLTIQLSEVAGLPLAVTATTMDDTALAGVDYLEKTEVLTIPAGESSVTFSVSVRQDSFFEMDESLSVGLSGVFDGEFATNTPTGTLTITNDDAQPTLSVADLTVVEGDSGTREVELIVSLSSEQIEDVTFNWQTANDTADGTDYGAVAPTLVTIPAGETVARLNVTLNGDADDELDEEFLVNLSDALLIGTPLVFTKSQARVKILNDDITVGVKEDITVNEGDSGETDAIFTIRLSAPSLHPVTVSYATQDGTAVSTGAAADFDATSGSVTFAPGETEMPVTVKVNGDVNFDVANAFSLVLSQPVNAKLGVSTGTATITEEVTDVRPMLAVADVTRLENANGGASTTPFQFHIVLDHASDETVVVKAQTFADTALAGSDFSTKTQDITFMPGETMKTFDVDVLNDSVFELEEQFRVVLSDAVNASLADGEALGIIQADADLPPRLMVTAQSVTEGNAGTKQMSFIVQRFGATEVPVTFNFETLSGSALAGDDFVAVNQQFTILPGQGSVSVNVLVNGDVDDEADETFTVQLTNVTGGRIEPAADGMATGMIFNDDLTVNLRSANVSVLEGDSGQSDLLFIVDLSAVSAHDVTVDYTVTAGTAAAGVDFQQPAVLSLTIPAGNTTGEIRVAAFGEQTGEADETLSLTLTGADGADVGTVTPSATGTILNDDAAITISDARVLEGNSGTTNMVFVVSLSNASVFPVTVHFTTIDSTASANSDFVNGAAVSGDLTFLAGDTQKEIIVPIKGDAIVEGDELFTVQLSDSRANGTPIIALLDSVAFGTIQDDEVFFTISDVTVVEGDSGTQQALFTISLTPSSAFPASVIATTMDDSALSTGGSPDFVARTQTISFVAGETTKTFAVTINGDLAFEPGSERFKVLLSGAVGALIVDGEGIGTINDPGDPAPVVSIADATIVEGDAGTKVLEFVVSLSAPAGADVLVDIATAFSGSADAADIVAAAQAGFVIPAGETSAKFSVTVNGDIVDEVDETFTVNLTNARTTLPGAAAPTTLAISDAQAAGRILNDDLSVSIVSTASDTEGDTGNKAFKIGVVLSSVSSHPVTVTYNVATGTAGAGDVVAGQNLTFTIPAGQAGGEISVDVKGDLLDEVDETFTVTLTGSDGAQLGTTTLSTVTITDNDATPTVTISSPSVTEGADAVFVVTLSAVSERSVTVKWVTESGTATGGDGSLSGATQGDFKQATLEQTLVIPAGQTSGEIRVRTVSDPDDEVAETFGVRILESTENATVAAGGVLGTATIAANDLSVLSITDATVVEGNNGTATLVFTVSRSGSGNKLPVTVEYSTSDGSASASAGDYVAANTTLTIPGGLASGTISITVNSDTLSELDETVFVTLRNPANATISDALGIGTIRNDEATYRLVPVTGQSLAVDEEGAGGAEQIVEFKVVREGALDKPGSVFFSTAVDDTQGANPAVSGTDFFALNSSVTFSVGAAEASETIKVRIRPDTTPEGVETFKLKLGTAVNGVLSATEAEQVITINESDTADLPSVVIENARIAEGTGSGTTNLVFKVKLVAADGTTPKSTGGNVVVRYETLSGTAITGQDFTAPAAGASVTIPAGQTEATVSIPISRDAVDEADETFLVNLVDAELTVPGVTATFPVALADASAEGTIANDDLTLTLDPVQSAPEGNADNLRTFTFRIPQASQHAVSVAYTLKDGTAVSTGAFADFDATTPGGVVMIPAGETEASFTVLVHGDLYAEGSEAFTIEFSGETGAILAASSVSVPLANDDAAPSLTIGDATIVEGNSGQKNLIFTVTLAGGTQEEVTVDFSTLDSTAMSTGVIVDYMATEGTRTFAASPNGGTQQISIPVFGDTWRELDETFRVVLSNAKFTASGTAVAFANSQAIGTIQNDGDTTLGLTLTGARVVEGDSVGGTVSFVAETTAPVTGSAVTFIVNTRPGTAQAADFTAITNRTVTIGAGTSSTTVAVQATADTVFELSEFMFLDASGFSAGVTPAGGGGGTLSARGIFLNDDVRILNARSFQYVDLDGDIVTVKLSKGSLSVPTGAALSTGDITFVRGGAPDVGGRFLQMLNLSNDGNEFAGVNIEVTSRVQVLADGTVLGDGKSNVGAIESSVPVAGLFQFTSGVALGRVEVSGDVGRVIAGSALRPAGVGVLKAGSFGAGANLPDSTGGLTADTSVVLGPIGQMIINGDFKGALLVIGDAQNMPIPTGPVGRIGKLVVKGNLAGGSEFGTGRILTTGGIGSATLGGIVGGSGDSSASIQGVNGFTPAIGKLTLLGDIVGGTGANSAVVEMAGIGQLNLGRLATNTSPAVEADIIGGTGASSGRIVSSGGIGELTMNGSLTGGAGERSGQVFVQNVLGKTRITGNMAGGAGNSSGALIAGVMSGAVTIEGDLKGGAGSDSGVITTNGIIAGFERLPGDAHSIIFGKAGVASKGSIIGGEGSGSGRVGIAGKLSKFTVFGDIVGGSNTSTGGITADGGIGRGSIKGDLVGGGTKLAGDGGPATLLRSGFIVGAGITSLVIEGQVITGKNLGTNLGGSAVIASSVGIGSITVNGTGSAAAVAGDATAAAVISARTSIGELHFGGDVEFAEILAGYSPVSAATAPRGTLANLDATIGKVIVDGTLRSTSIAAGVSAGGDGMFGTIDDQSTLTGTQPPVTAAISRIASVIATAVAAHADTPADASYGIVAEHVKAVSVGGTAVPLASGPHNDDAVAVGGAAVKLKVVET